MVILRRRSAVNASHKTANNDANSQGCQECSHMPYFLGIMKISLAESIRRFDSDPRLQFLLRVQQGLRRCRFPNVSRKRQQLDYPLTARCSGCTTHPLLADTSESVCTNRSSVSGSNRHRVPTEFLQEHKNWTAESRTCCTRTRC